MNDPDAMTGSADDALPGTADDWRGLGTKVDNHVTTNDLYRGWVLSVIRSFTPEHPMMVGAAVMADALKDPDLAALVDEGLIVETPMLPEA